MHTNFEKFYFKNMLFWVLGPLNAVLIRGRFCLWLRSGNPKSQAKYNFEGRSLKCDESKILASK